MLKPVSPTAGGVQSPMLNNDGPSNAQVIAANHQEKSAENAGNPDIKKGESKINSAEKQIKAGKAVSATGGGIMSVAGMMGSAALIAAPAFPIGTITAAAVGIAAAVVGLVGMLTSFVGNRIQRGGQGALQEGADLVSSGISKSKSATDNAKSLTKNNQLEASQDAVVAADKRIAKLQDEVLPSLRQDPEGNARAIRRAEKEIAQLDKSKTKHNERIAQIESSGTGNETLNAAGDVPDGGNQVAPTVTPESLDGSETPATAPDGNPANAGTPSSPEIATAPVTPPAATTPTPQVPVAPA